MTLLAWYQDKKKNKFFPVPTQIHITSMHVQLKPEIWVNLKISQMPHHWSQYNKWDISNHPNLKVQSFPFHEFSDSLLLLIALSVWRGEQAPLPQRAQSSHCQGLSPSGLGLIVRLRLLGLSSSWSCSSCNLLNEFSPTLVALPLLHLGVTISSSSSWSSCKPNRFSPHR